MGFNSVYKALQDVFPQVDSRVLRAVAIEHSKDADAAVEVVLVEVIPFLSKQMSRPGSSSNESGSLIRPSEAGDRPDDAIVLEPEHLDASVDLSSFHAVNEDNDRVCGEIGDDDLISLQKHGNSKKASPDMSSYNSSSASVHEYAASADHDQGCSNHEGEEASSQGKPQVNTAEVSGSIETSNSLSPTPTHEDTGASASMIVHVHADSEDLNQSVSAIDGASNQGQLSANGIPSDVRYTVQQADSPVHEVVLRTEDSELQFVESDLHFGAWTDAQITDFENPEPINSLNVDSKEDISTSVMLVFDDESNMNATVTESSQSCNIDLLEDMVEDARHNKKILVLAMDSILGLMREVDVKEKAAERAKEEADQRCLDTYAKVDELKQALLRAREANDMHAGEVYAEKAILSTEMKELQLRLFSLSDERNRSLGILNEICKALEERLTAAEKEMEAAEQEKLEKETSARAALAYQELMMENVVQESKILKQVAEENSKLQEFLMDRGRLVDTLQGEISVKCQDVVMLKEKFDRHVPLSKFLSSSQSSSILGSSTSSSRSVTSPEQLPSLADHETLKKSADPADRFGFMTRSTELADSSETLKTVASETNSNGNDLSPADNNGGDSRKLLVEFGWELCENGDY